MSDIDSASEREVELALALAELIHAVNASLFWIDKSTPEGQQQYVSLRGAAHKAERELLGFDGHLMKVPAEG
jgi:hypothetical protein